LTIAIGTSARKSRRHLSEKWNKGAHDLADNPEHAGIGRQLLELTMNKQSAAKRTASPKALTTQDVVSKVQSITAGKNGGRQAEWVRNLQSFVDKERAAASKLSRSK
jgi:hypothetical protein